MSKQLVGYATVGTNNKSKAIAFYDPIMKELGAEPFFSNELACLNNSEYLFLFTLRILSLLLPEF